MSHIFVSLLKGLLFLLLLGLLFLGGLALAYQRGWPLWTAGIWALGLPLLLAVFLLLRRCYYRRREEKFVRRVVQQDAQTLLAANRREQERLDAMRARWAAAVSTLRSSKLRLRGDPLYSLPWFMIMGETGSGKTTAVSHARLHSMLSEAGPVRGGPGTRNCDWWFFEEAVILDTAGRYAVPLDTDADDTEWNAFMELLGKYRRREPLNGLVLTLPADKLLQEGEEAQGAAGDYGRTLRRRVDQLTRLLGARFPIYVLVTKIDQILGMAVPSALLSETERTQALGLLNDDEKGSAAAFVQRAVEHVARRLKDMRLLLADVRLTGSEPGLAFFPDELERLGPGIQAFTDGLFRHNPYSETPWLRGLFFASGRQSGLARSGVLRSSTVLKNRSWPLPDTEHALFLHDFFSFVLPRDRRRYRLLGDFLSFDALSRNLGYAIWLSVLAGILLFSTHAYIETRRDLAEVQRVFPRPPQFNRGMDADIVPLATLSKLVETLEARLSASWWPDMGLNQGRELAAFLKAIFCERFSNVVVETAEKNMRDARARGGRDIGDDYLLAYSLWYSELLETAGASDPKRDLPSPPLFGPGADRMPPFLEEMYINYAMWLSPAGRAREAMQARDEINAVLAGRPGNLHWLPEWLERTTAPGEVTLADFWPVVADEKPTARIRGAYTAAGAQGLADALNALKKAVGSETLTERERAFWAWYVPAAEEEWWRFAARFDEAADLLHTPAQWKSMAAVAGGPENPYFYLLDRMGREFAAMEATAGLSSEADEPLPVSFAHLYAMYEEELHKDARPIGSKLLSGAAEGLRRMESRVNEQQALHLERESRVLTAFREYLKQLAAMQPYMAAPDAALRFAAQNFGRQGDPQSPSTLALVQLNKLEQLVPDRTAPHAAEFRRLLEGPLRFAIMMITDSAGCALNEAWESMVLALTAQVPENELWNALFGENGHVAQFLEKSGKPFLRATAAGWIAQSWNGVPFPVQQTFLDFLSRGESRRQLLQPKYTVRIASEPFSADEGASSQPYRVLLRLQCASGSRELDNYNYPQQTDFVWEPAVCGATRLDIYFKEFTLSKTWDGPWGFKDFLRFFRDGMHIFVPGDFPSHKARLEGMGVQNITVGFHIEGAAPVLELGPETKVWIPTCVVDCRMGLAAGRPATQVPLEMSDGGIPVDAPSFSGTDSVSVPSAPVSATAETASSLKQKADTEAVRFDFSVKTGDERQAR